MVLRPWLDGRIPESRGPGVLLAAGRADVEVMFVELVGDSAARVYFPADSDNEVVCSASEGAYSVGAACPAVLGADGRVAMVYPPLVTEGDPVFVGETTATIIESVEAVSDDVQATNAIIEAHEGKILAVEEGVEETKDLLAATDSVVDGLAVEVARNTVDIEGAVDAALAAKAAADSAVTGSVTQYALAASRTVAPTSGWSTSSPTPTTALPYVWLRSVVSYGSGDTVTTAPTVVTGPAGAKGDTGADGVPGNDGVGLESTAVTYAKSASGTTAPTSGWTSTVPTSTPGQFLWTRTVWTYTDDTTETGYSVAMWGATGAKGDKGDTGSDGIAGKDGVGIVDTTITYAVSTSGTSAPSSGWQAAPPSASAGQYVWTKTVWTYSDDTSETGYSVGKIGNTGAQGAKGDTGAQGVSITGFARFYALVDSGAAGPPTPAANSTPAAPWVASEPAFTLGKDLWTTDQVTYSNGARTYTAAARSSAYVASSQAISIANATTEQLAHAFDEEPPSDPVEGAWWYPRDEAGNITGMWRWNGVEWGTHATLTGLLLVPTADGGQTLIGPDGVEATSIVADILRTDVLYADVAGVQTLVITDIPRQNLAEDVGEALATAEDLGSRIVLSGGQLTIARNRVSDNEPLTAVTLGATSLDFVVDGKAVAYIDSELEQMSIANGLFRDSMTVGSHQVRTLPGSQVTIWQAVN